jgi:hypothetical protein
MVPDERSDNCPAPDDVTPGAAAAACREGGPDEADGWAVRPDCNDGGLRAAWALCGATGDNLSTCPIVNL